MAFKIEPCWFGDRKVIYVQVEDPSHKGSGRQKHFVVYGHSLDRVTSEVFNALGRIFGWHGGGSPRRGRPRKKRTTTRKSSKR